MHECSTSDRPHSPYGKTPSPRPPLGKIPFPSHPGWLGPRDPGLLRRNTFGVIGRNTIGDLVTARAILPRSVDPLPFVRGQSCRGIQAVLELCYLLGRLWLRVSPLLPKRKLNPVRLLASASSDHPARLLFHRAAWPVRRHLAFRAGSSRPGVWLPRSFAAASTSRARFPPSLSLHRRRCSPGIAAIEPAVRTPPAWGRCRQADSNSPGGGPVCSCDLLFDSPVDRRALLCAEDERAVTCRRAATGPGAGPLRVSSTPAPHALQVEISSRCHPTTLTRDPAYHQRAQ